MTELAIVGAFFSAVMAIVVVTGYALLRRRADSPTESSLLDQAFASVGKFVAGTSSHDDPLRRQLVRAGYGRPSAIAIFWGLRVAASVGLAAVLSILTTQLRDDETGTLLPTLCGAGIGYYLPTGLLRRAVRKRKQRLRRALPDGLDLCILSVEAGQSLDQALLDVSRGLRRSHPDLAAELQLVHLETRASNDRGEALRNLAARTDEPELRKLAFLFNDADRFGAGVAPALRNHSRYLRTRLRQQAQEAARKVAVKLVFAVFFLIFPPVLLVTLAPAIIMVTNQLRDLTFK
jgi:tight adherence protein C